mgnify:CR=1 FL=1
MEDRITSCTTSCMTSQPESFAAKPHKSCVGNSPIAELLPQRRGTYHKTVKQDLNRAHKIDFFFAARRISLPVLHWRLKIVKKTS